MIYFVLVPFSGVYTRTGYLQSVCRSLQDYSSCSGSPPTILSSLFCSPSFSSSCVRPLIIIGLRSVLHRPISTSQLLALYLRQYGPPSAAGRMLKEKGWKCQSIVSPIGRRRRFARWTSAPGYSSGEGRTTSFVLLRHAASPQQSAAHHQILQSLDLQSTGRQIVAPYCAVIALRMVKRSSRHMTQASPETLTFICPDGRI